jgi:hypothetical protein
MKKTITAFLLVGSVLLTGCGNNESTDNSLVNDELPQVAGTISESYDGFEDTTGESNSTTVFSHSSRAVAKGADTPTSGPYFSFDENMPANTGSKVNLTKYVQVVTNGNSDQTTTFKAYILNDSNNQYAAFQVESGSTTIYLSKAKTLYVNVEAGELTATLEIYVSQSKLCADYMDFFSTLGNNYSLSKRSITPMALFWEMRTFFMPRTTIMMIIMKLDMF